MKKILSGNKSRLAVLLAFFTNGALMATWVSRIPAIQSKLGLSEGALGLLFFGLSAGMLSALFLAGGLIARFGSPRVTGELHHSPFSRNRFPPNCAVCSFVRIWRGIRRYGCGDERTSCSCRAKG
jgi:hypothetical protein